MAGNIIVKAMLMTVLSNVASMLCLGADSARLDIAVHHLSGAALADGRLSLWNADHPERASIQIPVVDGSALVKVPFGTYVVYCCEEASALMGPTVRIVAVEEEVVTVWLTVNARGHDLEDEKGRRVWTLSGSLPAGMSAKGSVARACRVGEMICKDSAVQPNGTFQVKVQWVGYYLLVIVHGEKVVAAGQVEIDRASGSRGAVVLRPL